ncbi:hypothetical protein [Desulfoscipio gibsoniae]|uniref:Uncharacterized protein n=1 Tax=Desulfoscipio gibsoniae DSM 7213 TaxID=767817 RepID=R4KMI0_9FIRM|nr:hypothetical protein [Desulfoscipio gibsoniae]AGL01745.1 hypothetical protein Desgi_2326 [Desulfoscipio gibsoniae DSM 7213]
MRIIARVPDQKQVGFLVDTLRNGGFDRKDMIISDLAKADDERKTSSEEMADEVAFVKTEREGLWEAGPYADGIKGLEHGKRGFIVAVETSKHEASRVRAMMEQSGAVEIIQD